MRLSWVKKIIHIYLSHTVEYPLYAMLKWQVLLTVSKIQLYFYHFSVYKLNIPKRKRDFVSKIMSYPNDEIKRWSVSIKESIKKKVIILHFQTTNPNNGYFLLVLVPSYHNTISAMSCTAKSLGDS